MKPIYLIFLRAGGWIAILFIWLGLIIAASGILALQNAKRLAVEGVETTAEITKTSAHAAARAGKSDDLGGSDYFVEYLLATPDGPLANTAKVNRRFYDTVREGDEVLLRYLPLSPEVHELYTGQLSRSGQSTTVVGVAVLGLGLLITLGFGLIARRGVRVLQGGVKVQAIVLKKSRVVFLTRLRFGFKLPNGKVETNKSFWRFERAHRGIKTRDLIGVKYERAAPRTSFWQGDLTRRK